MYENTCFMLYKNWRKNMNRCIISGEILEDVKFEFLFNNKNISIAMCNIKLSNNSKVIIYRIR